MHVDCYNYHHNFNTHMHTQPSSIQFFSEHTTLTAHFFPLFDWEVFWRGKEVFLPPPPSCLCPGLLSLISFQTGHKVVLMFILNLPGQQACDVCPSYMNTHGRCILE